MAENQSKKDYAECLITSDEYLVQHDKYFLESIQYKSEGNEEQAIESIKIANEFATKSLEQTNKFCSQLRPQKRISE